MKDMNRQAAANALMGSTPQTDVKTITVIYYGEVSFYLSVVTQVAGSHRHEWSRLYNGFADKVAQQMLETDEFKDYTLIKQVR
jgi:hypothetical protein